jgi:phosphohistidine phosphatase
MPSQAGKDRSLADRDRPLVGRGKRAAKAVAAHIEAGAKRARMEEKYPTAALATIDLSADEWSSIERGSGELVAYVRPRDLA